MGMRVKSRALLTLCIAVGFLWACSTGISGGNLSALPSAQPPTLVNTQPTPWPTSTRWPYSTVPQPSPAPTPTGRQSPLGVILPYSTMPALPQPLTEEQALEQALRLDDQVSRWEKPWSLESVQTEPGRVTVIWYRNMADYRDKTGHRIGLSPEIEADYGSIWRITILGRRQSLTACGLCGDTPRWCDAVTYLFSQRTGTNVALIECFDP